jgi:hypothetical protein
MLGDAVHKGYPGEHASTVDQRPGTMRMRSWPSHRAVVPPANLAQIPVLLKG